MKCIHCGTDSKKRQRTDGRCPRCRHRLAFEPATDTHGVTDPQFKAAVDRVSGGGKVHFTERALWYEFNRKWMKPGVWRSPYGWFPVLGAVPAALSALEVLPFGVLPAGIIGVTAGVFFGALLSSRAGGGTSSKPPRIPFSLFQTAYLAKWRAAHGDLPGPLPPRDAQLAAPAREVPGDVAAFSFDRAVVTDRWETAAMLVANRFHFEHNCAVLSHDGYPEGIADTVKTMLGRNPGLTVFALHDASPDGCMLPLQLREQDWFPDPAVRIVDVGLRPAHVRKLRIPTLQGHAAQLHPRLGEVLPPEDVAWLAQRPRVGELAALRPAQVMRAVYQAIAAVAAADASGTSWDSGASGGDGGGFWMVPMGGGGSGSASTDGFG